jgi:hypothetical protein
MVEDATGFAPKELIHREANPAGLIGVWGATEQKTGLSTGLFGSR